MNPFRSPTADEAPIDDSVLAVSSNRGPAIVFAMLAWVLALVWSGMMLWESGPYSWWSLGIPFCFLIAILASMTAAGHCEILAIGGRELTIYCPSPLDGGRVTLGIEEVESIEWGIGYECDTVTLKLGESVHGAVYRSKAWSKASPATREVCWQVDHDASMNCERSEIREALRQWLNDANHPDDKKQLTVARIP
ncbi:hypothetical protein Pla123a_25700 [Posidoniimonas polymericola]|uniref:Uncharacterized protein n=1 Tax=Posidoniimonas polymericola TaxID=2528002 RepID=A0A5C5YQL2_9BACT|nr:hypothetical protein [Posidoniimonas polymericola]TWT77139.1 hypothetical protein Pla123a_25700 [Posidoniimonas polymericola]